MRVVLNVTGAFPEIREELERVPPRDRAEFARGMMMLGILARRSSALGVALVPAAAGGAIPPPPAPERTDSADRRRLVGKGLSSLKED